MAVDPAAGPVVRTLLAVGRWRRALRVGLGAVAAYMAVELLPYALWTGPAPLWAVAGLLAAGALWMGLPLAARVCELRRTVTEAELGPGSEAAALLGAAGSAAGRFREAAHGLPTSADWPGPAGRRLDEAVWLVALRARDMAAIDRSLGQLHRQGPAGDLRSAEEQRLSSRRTGHRDRAVELIGEMDALADSAERAARTSGSTPGGAGGDWSARERAAVDGLRRHRLHLDAVEAALEEVAGGGPGSGGQTPGGRASSGPASDRSSA